MQDVHKLSLYYLIFNKILFFEIFILVCFSITVNTFLVLLGLLVLFYVCTITALTTRLKSLALKSESSLSSMLITNSLSRLIF